MEFGRSSCFVGVYVILCGRQAQKYQTKNVATLQPKNAIRGPRRRGNLIQDIAFSRHGPGHLMISANEMHCCRGRGCRFLEDNFKTIEHCPQPGGKQIVLP